VSLKTAALRVGAALVVASAIACGARSSACAPIWGVFSPKVAESEALQARFACLLSLVTHLLAHTLNDKNTIYALHASEAVCFTKD
jgi:hypothetical protein